MLSDLTKKEILLMINYNKFNLDLKEKLKNSKNNIRELNINFINEIWINEFKQYYLYNEIFEKINIYQEISFQTIETILKNNNIIKIFQGKNPYSSIYNFMNFGQKNNIEEKIIGSDIIYYPKEFDIVSPSIYNDLININNDKNYNNYNSINLGYNCLINDEKIIIKFNYNKKFIILIGNTSNIDKKNNKIYIESLLFYLDEYSMENHFNILKQLQYRIFIDSFSDEQFLYDNNYQIGKIYILHKDNNNKIEHKSNNYGFLNKDTIKHIKFLLLMHFNNENLNYKINQLLKENPKIEKYYLINEDSFNKIKSFYNYNELIKIFSEPEINALISKYKYQNSYIPENKIEEFIINLMKILPLPYYNSIKDKNNDNTNKMIDIIEISDLFDVKPFNYKDVALYYDNIELIEGTITKLMDKNNENIKKYSANCIFCQNIIFIIFKDIINIGHLDNNNVFKTEIIIKMNEINNLNLKVIINQIRQFEFNGFKTILFFDENNTSKIHNTNFTVWKLSESNDNNNNYFNNKNNKNDNSISSTKLILSSVKIEELNSLIMIYIDYYQIKNKMKNALILNYNNNNINSNDNYYYLVNYNWFIQFLTIYKLDKIFNYLMNKDITKTINNFNELPNEERTAIIKYKIEKEFKNQINNNNIDFSSLQDFKLFNIKYKYINIKSNKNLKYYYQFLLLKEETYKLLVKDLKINNAYQLFPCYLGEGKIFLIIKEDNQFTIEVGHINEQNEFIIELFLDFFSNNFLNTNIFSLIDKGYEEYCKCSLIMNENDYVSPIFKPNFQIEGYAYKYNNNNSIEYRNYIINKYLILLVKFYLYNEQLKKFIFSKVEFKNYYLINEDWLNKYKSYFNYDYLKNEFKNNQVLQNIINNLKINNVVDDNILFNEKRIALSCKQLPFKINVMINQKENNILSEFINNFQIEPYLENYFYKNEKYLMFYNKFEILTETIYNLIFKQDNYNKHKNNYVQCLFLENIIMIKLSENITNINKFVLEVGNLNNENVFIAKYILIYNEENNFYWHINYIYKTLNINFSFFLKTLTFNNNNYITLNNESNNEIGIIYNLNIKYQNNKGNNIFPKNINNIPNISNIPNTPNIPNIPNISFIPNMPNMLNISNTPIISNIPNISNLNKQKQSSIKNYFNFPPLIGLQNVGATCYMNATIQCFCQIEKLVDYFKFKPRISEVFLEYHKKNKDCLTAQFKYLIENLWPTDYNYINNQYNHKNSNNKYFAPYKFKEIISKMNPLFAGAQANDSKDLVNFIIMTLHEELNKAQKTDLSINNNQFIDQTNQKLIFDNFTKHFYKENQSIISDIFYGMNGTSTQCSNCKIVKYNFQIYFFLIFPLEEVRKYKMEVLTKQFTLNYQNMLNINPMLYQQNFINFQMNLQNMNSVNINDCFQYNEKMEYFTGENAMYCNNCKQQLPASYCTKLYTGPDTLIIVLNRGKGIEFKVKLEFYEDLNLMNFIQYQQTGYMYKLIGVVTHMGESGASGHFIAYCKSPIDLQWYRYNDDIVTKVIEFKKEIIDYAMPYILFFKKIK